MKVAASARYNFRKGLLAAGLNCDLTDGEVDSLIRDLRRTLGSNLGVTGLQAQAEVLVDALAPIRDKLLCH